MGIAGIEGMTVDEVHREVERGGRFVVYGYCISVVVVTFRRSNPPRFIPAGGNRVVPGLSTTLISVLLGWWGIPWGPIYTFSTMVKNFRGGTDVTADVLARMPPMVAAQAPVAQAAGSAMAAGWYQDPAGRHQNRWWDGSDWTDQAASDGVQVSDAM